MTFARKCFQALPINNLDVPARVTDQAIALKFTSCFADSGTPYAEHILPVANMARVLNDQLSTYSTEQEPKQEMVSGKIANHFHYKKCKNQRSVELA